MGEVLSVLQRNSLDLIKSQESSIRLQAQYGLGIEAALILLPVAALRATHASRQIWTITLVIWGTFFISIAWYLHKQQVLKLQVDTANAKCGNVADTDMINVKLQATCSLILPTTDAGNCYRTGVALRPSMSPLRSCGK